MIPCCLFRQIRELILLVIPYLTGNLIWESLSIREKQEAES